MEDENNFKGNALVTIPMEEDENIDSPALVILGQLLDRYYSVHKLRITQKCQARPPYNKPAWGSSIINFVIKILESDLSAHQRSSFLTSIVIFSNMSPQIWDWKAIHDYFDNASFFPVIDAFRFVAQVPKEFHSLDDATTRYAHSQAIVDEMWPCEIPC